MSTALVQILPHSPTLWSCFAAAVVALSAPIGWIFSARYKYRAGTIDAETRQKIALREQDRLDRAIQSQGATSRLAHTQDQSELDGRASAIPAVPSQPGPAQVEKKAA